ncbi:unnamed protein product [Brassica oleracea]
MAHPSDLKFSPIDQNLVGYYLRNRVDTGKDGFITDIKLYEDEPWLLPHVKNDQFKENMWFYFVVRTRNLGSRPKRTVPGRGSSDGGTWTTSGVKKAITDRNNPKVVIGYKTELAYHKKVKGKTKGDTTGWCMTEYWLASENDAQFQEVVLCHLRDNNKIVVDQSPERKNGDNDIVTEQAQQENSDDNNNMFDNNRLLEQRPLIPPFEAHDSRFPVQYMTPSGEGQGLGLQTIMGYSDKATQEQQYPPISLPPQRQDSGRINNALVIMEDECVNQDEIFNLADLEAGITHPQQQHRQMMMDPYDDISFSRLAMPNNLIYFQDSWHQDTSPWNNTITTNPRGLIFNTHGYDIQDQTVTKGVNQDSYY